jgi:hypothetical protein
LLCFSAYSRHLARCAVPPPPLPLPPPPRYLPPPRTQRTADLQQPHHGVSRPHAVCLQRGCHPCGPDDRGYPWQHHLVQAGQPRHQLRWSPFLCMYIYLYVHLVVHYPCMMDSRSPRDCGAVFVCGASRASGAITWGLCSGAGGVRCVMQSFRWLHHQPPPSLLFRAERFRLYGAHSEQLERPELHRPATNHGCQQRTGPVLLGHLQWIVRASLCGGHGLCM